MKQLYNTGLEHYVFSAESFETLTEKELVDSCERIFPILDIPMYTSENRKRRKVQIRVQTAANILRKQGRAE